uniref:Uncharacterized protein n=1 Tax=Romanomermis culicivorax TaxID=13658 RepID=A0A915LA92_ROMCU
MWCPDFECNLTNAFADHIIYHQFSPIKSSCLPTSLSHTLKSRIFLGKSPKPKNSISVGKVTCDIAENDRRLPQMEPNGTKIFFSFGYIPLIAFRYVPFRRKRQV